MNFSICRYNKNHKVKSSRIDIHEQKCPDRLKYQNKFKLCPYNPSHKIEKELYEKHVSECPNKPKLTFEEEEDMKRAKKMDEVATEQEQIKYDRMRLYKDCVKPDEIIGLNKNMMKKSEKKQEKILKKIFKPMVEYDCNHLKEMDEKEFNQADGEDNSHIINNFGGDDGFDLDNETKREKTEIEEHFYKYDPNDEDEDIDKYSANRINPKEIENILENE